MDRASASPAASTGGSPAVPRTSSSCSRSARRSQIDGPQPVRSDPQSEPHVVLSRRVPRPSSLALARIRQRLPACRIFTPAQPTHSVASSEGFLLRRLQSSSIQRRSPPTQSWSNGRDTSPRFNRRNALADRGRTIDLLPVEVGRLADASLAAHIRHRHPVSALLQDGRLWASEHREAFIVLRSSQPGNQHENSSRKRSSFAGSEHFARLTAVTS